VSWASALAEALHILLDLHKKGTALGGRKPVEEVARLLVHEELARIEVSSPSESESMNDDWKVRVMQQ
jgi:hypothetical protein